MLASEGANDGAMSWRSHFDVRLTCVFDLPVEGETYSDHKPRDYMTHGGITVRCNGCVRLANTLLGPFDSTANNQISGRKHVDV